MDTATYSRTNIRPTAAPLLERQGEDGDDTGDIWHLDLPDAEATIVLTTEQMRRIVDDYLEQSLSGGVVAETTLNETIAEMKASGQLPPDFELPR